MRRSHETPLQGIACSFNLCPKAPPCQRHVSLPSFPRMNFRDKILSWEALPAWRQQLRDQNKRLVATNGCFDILHLGHVAYLEAARNTGDALLVAVNGDASVRGIKGPGRPINSQADRATVLAALASVDAVCIFEEPTALRLLSLVRPAISATGGAY